MTTNDTVTLEQQRQRRKRVNRIKTGIILTIVIWMLASLLAIILLSVQVVRLNHRIERLEAALNDSVSADVSFVETEDAGDVLETDTQAASGTQLDYDKIETGIDTPDNMADFDRAVQASLARTGIWKIAVEEITGKAKR